MLEILHKQTAETIATASNNNNNNKGGKNAMHNKQIK